MTHLQWTAALTAAQIADVDALLQRVSDADGVSSLSEHTYLHLLAGGSPGMTQGLLTDDSGAIIGYAGVIDGQPPVAEFLVDPAARGAGYGRQLLDAVVEVAGPQVRVWAHGQLPAARELAQSGGFEPVRSLCRYTRSLTGITEVELPPGVEVRTFTHDDATAWLELNAEAFVDLPDQGSWTRADLEERLSQPWFDADGFLLAFDEQGLAGFHWTKVHGGSGHAHERIGEVYVLGVATRARGTGLGKALTHAGLRYLAHLGLSTVMLYVDTSNQPAVKMYEQLGFRCADCDVQYALT
ncbi:MAG: mycothiol synthase [Candidatus Nanopelagicales bacterium]|nr:mycothiol synthase [Candidatus Nanopelagicales bacterium]MCU0294824.1 mycothiol synthase [Candidatus Nanopelagicales bacterium]